MNETDGFGLNESTKTIWGWQPQLVLCSAVLGLEHGPGGWWWQATDSDRINITKPTMWITFRNMMPISEINYSAKFAIKSTFSVKCGHRWAGFHLLRWDAQATIHLEIRLFWIRYGPHAIPNDESSLDIPLCNGSNGARGILSYPKWWACEMFGIHFKWLDSTTITLT